MFLKSNTLAFTVTSLLCFLLTNSWASNPLQTFESLDSSSLLVVDTNHHILHSKNADEPLIPASTVKILTALIALEHWGEDHRFSTDFYFDSSLNYLWIKGYGDPYLISEELDLIVDKLKEAGITEFDGIGVDTSYFDRSIKIDGQGKSLNPYDASVGALASNFNTINIRVYEDSISSSEEQTPLTPIAEELSQGLGIGTHRINLGDAELGPRYFSELLKSKLNRKGILAEVNYMSGSIPTSAKLLFTYKNSHTLEQIISSMLEFSNNFIANQLYFLLGAELIGAPASLWKSQTIVTDYVKQNFEWENYEIVEGAGLSTKNRLSAHQLVDLLNRFKAYRHLLPAQNSHILAKSGTLKNVSTYAGYLNRGSQWLSFALMINQRVNFTFREKLAIELLK
ncbi:MAG: D-alanyl-D-alanine carboxypeptidase/D-alanyl-D-alanine-endopeptidase [Gammaproteobacteria bacterium]